jgi:hypothetical protein
MKRFACHAVRRAQWHLERQRSSVLMRLAQTFAPYVPPVPQSCTSASA